MSPTRSAKWSSNMIFGNMSGAMEGGPHTLPASMAAWYLISASRVSAVAMIAKSSNTALPAM